MIGVCGLFFFMVGYALVRKVLQNTISRCTSAKNRWVIEPGRCAVFRSLAEQESDLLQRLGKGVLARHGDFEAVVTRGGEL